MTRGRHSERLHMNFAPVAQAGAFYWAGPPDRRPLCHRQKTIPESFP